MVVARKPQWIKAYERFHERLDWLDELLAPYLFEGLEPNGANLKMLFEEQQMLEAALRKVGEQMLVYSMENFPEKRVDDWVGVGEDDDELP